LFIAQIQNRPDEHRDGFDPVDYVRNARSSRRNFGVALWPWDLTAWWSAKGNTSAIVPLMVRVHFFFDGNFRQSAETRFCRFAIDRLMCL